MLPCNRVVAAISVIHRCTMETRSSLVAELIAYLRANGAADCTRKVRWIMTEEIGCSMAHLLAFPELTVERGHVQRIRSMIRRCARREPLQYILGYTEFRGLRIRVTPAVLIPRPETEQVAEAALKCIEYVRKPRIMDIGTGSGCLALALKHERSDAQMMACDNSTAALAVARQNAAVLGLDISFAHTDIFASDPFRGVEPMTYDLIVSNPPYVTHEELSTLQPEVRCHEPLNALYAGRDPVRFYRRIAKRIGPALLKDGGFLVLESHAEYSDAVCKVLRDARFSAIAVTEDLSGRPRIVAARWRNNLSCKNAYPGLTTRDSASCSPNNLDGYSA